MERLEKVANGVFAIPHPDKDYDEKTKEAIQLIKEGKWKEASSKKF